MRRRQFLKGLGAAGISAGASSSTFAQGVAGASRVQRVIVIGAGIVGASIAYNLARRGAEVIVIEKTAPAAQASGNSFAWINASWYDTPQSYFDLRTHALNEYHRLARDVDIPVRWGGSLEWYADDAEQQAVVDGVARIQSAGAPAWMIDAGAAREIEPRVHIDADRRIAWCSRDGAVDPAAATNALLDRVTALGGEVLYPATVTGFDFRRDGVFLQTSAGRFSADLAVIAAGVGSADLARRAGLGSALLRPATPGIIVTTEPMPAMLNTISYTSDTHFLQRADGRVVIGEKAGPPDTDQHRALLAGLPNAYPDETLAAEHATRVIGTASRYVRELADAVPGRVGVGWRPLPVDGLPIVGHPLSVPGLYLAVMHSGVTLAPLVGHLAAMEILDGVRVDGLADFRYERLVNADSA